jgi:hypothetical protein
MLSKNRRNLAVATFVLGLGVGVTTGVSSAASSAQKCDAAGGTFDRSTGTAICVLPTIVDPVGQSEASGGKSQSRDTTPTETGQGNLDNKDADTASTTGPGKSNK